ncbi:MAG: response regulator [Spirochaetes bacterium]|nr:response regulator [Spirochaetota bacterium]MBU0956064.1 response regulator [Spirochaetota bacterium]
MTLPETLFEAAFNQARQAMIILNEQGMPVLWNEAFYELFYELSGQSPEKLAVPLFDWLQERDSFQYSYYITEVLLGRMGAATIESNLKTAQNSRVWLRTTLSLLNTAREVDDPQQTERWLWCMFQNITDQKRHEHDLVSAKESAEKATITKSQFLANMSHEIRTPIQTILGMTELLHETGLDKEQQDYIGSVRFSADVLLGLINDILDFSKIEAGKVELEHVDFDLFDILRQSVALLILDAHKKQLEVILDIDPRLPRLIRGDPGKLRQIVVNLFKNAIKFTSAGEIIIEAQLQSTRGRNELLLQVRDSGSGVPAKLMDHLFTPFTQANAGSTTHGGTGLGLAISQYLVKIMGGRIFHEHNQPHGAIFGFTYPLTEAEYSLPGLEHQFSRTAAVLIVDDHPAALDYICRQTANMGLECHTATNGHEAIEQLQKAAVQGRPYNLCLIDQEMPGMDGWRLAAEITADRQINSTRLILMAPEGAIDPEAKMKHLNWFNAYLYKPLNPQVLYETLDRVLEEKTELDLADDDEAAVDIRPDNSEMNLSILLAEDHVVNQELFTLLLQKLGCTVDVADNGQEAVSKALAQCYDMVLMDIFMPVMDGYEASRLLRQQGYSRPIIAVTASALKGERDKCIATGMNDILIKPFKRKDLESMISFWANKTCGRQQADFLVPAETPGAACAEDPTFDFNELVETFLGQKATVISLIGRFIAKTRGQLAEMAAAVQQEDCSQMRELSHSIKGAAWNMTARVLGNAARDMEAAAKAGRIDQLTVLLPILEQRFMEFESAAREAAPGA